MRFILVALLALVLGTVRAGNAQQCHGDLNSNGRADIGDAIAVVNEILNGCGGSPARTPTPTQVPSGDQCPFDFNDHNFSSDFCTYQGPASSSCVGTFTIGGAWQSNGSNVLAVLVDPTGSVGITATRMSATSARVVSIAAGPDFTETVSATGSMSLPSARRFDASINTTGSCSDLGFQGTFVTVLNPDDGGGVRRAAGALGSVGKAITGKGGPAAEDPSTADAAALLRRFVQARAGRH